MKFSLITFSVEWKIHDQYAFENNNYSWEMIIIKYNGTKEIWKGKTKINFHLYRLKENGQCYWKFNLNSNKNLHNCFLVNFLWLRNSIEIKIIESSFLPFNIIGIIFLINWELAGIILDFINWELYLSAWKIHWRWKKAELYNANFFQVSKPSMKFSLRK